LAEGQYVGGKLWVWAADDYSQVKDKDKPFIEPLVRVRLADVEQKYNTEIAPELQNDQPHATPAPKPRAVAQQRARRQQEQEFNPIGAFLAFITPKADSSW
jgi:hypothetical protein